MGDMRFTNMKVRFVYRIFPAFITYTNDMNPGTGGYAIRATIYIRPEYQHDNGIHAHELTHVRQWWRNPLFHRWLYKRSRQARLQYEIEAFVTQLREYPIDELNAKFKRFAFFLATKYDLRISEEEAERELRDQYA
jgi:hypothetical protein